MPEQSGPAFGVALDPFRPTEILTPPGVATRPPICPSDICISQVESVVYFLYVVNTNNKGDALLTCLNCGYEAVYRVEEGKYAPRPGRPAERWKPPILSLKEAKHIAKGGVTPTPKVARGVKKAAGVKAAQPDKAAVDTDPEYSPKLAAEHAKKSLDTIYEAIRLKRLKALKKDGKTTIKHKDLQDYLQRYPARG
jgi:hypothetical protein